MSVGSFFLKAAATLITPVRYVEKGVEHMKENIKEEAEEITANAIKFIVLGITALLFLIFFCITLALLLNSVLESSYLGFAIITGVFLLGGIILYATREAESHNKLMRANARRIWTTKNGIVKVVHMEKVTH
jgi:cobalamin biosynthesis protein CobD/CbiB